MDVNKKILECLEKGEAKLNSILDFVAPDHIFPSDPRSFLSDPFVLDIHARLSSLIQNNKIKGTFLVNDKKFSDFETIPEFDDNGNPIGFDDIDVVWELGDKYFEEMYEQSRMTPDEVNHHLNILQERYGITNEEVLKQAAEGTLPRDADHDMWLILLDRSDLMQV